MYQIAPSTPGVFLPRFETTRLTANALPLNERVRSHCKAFTLPWRPSLTAFAIRICSLKTSRRAACQSMHFHPLPLAEGAPVNLTIAAICFPSQRRFSKRSRNGAPALDVGSLSGRVMSVALNPYPSHYRAAFASSSLLRPHFQQRALRFRLLQYSEAEIRGFHVPRL